MRLQWNTKAVSDLDRTYNFLAPKFEHAAQRVPLELLAAPDRLIEHLRIGERIRRFEPREIRRLLIGDYEMQYALHARTSTILCIWHAREDR